jgi:nicotinamidase-related amidase
MNLPLVEALDASARIVIAGEAGSHCVRATTEHLAQHLPSGRIDKLVLLSDCMSPVAGFERQQQDFLAAMRARGAAVRTSEEFARELAA